jgi:hypothetical protein
VKRSLLVALLAGILGAAGGVDRLAAQAPDERWRTLDTPHFHVHFTPELEPLARRAAVRAETAYAELGREFVAPPRGRIDLVIADNVDFANGFATPFPTNRVVVYAHAPVDNRSLAFYDDWLELVITHELFHIFHLDYARGLPKRLRTLFGRSPLLFPHLFLPGWTIEGLATYWESRLTEAGRVNDTMHEMALRTAILEGSFFPIDRATGPPTRWPGGATPYVYGSLFVEHLAERAGPDATGRFTERLGGMPVPYLGNERAARDAFGTGFRRAWTEWRDSLQTRYTAQADSLRAAGVTEPEVVSEAGRFAHHPRYAPDGSLAFAAYTGREEPQTRVIDPAGRERVLARRSSIGPSTWLPDGSLVSAQIEPRGPYRRFSDLQRIAPDGRRTRLTRGARLLEPDAAPDGRRIVAVRSAAGATSLVTVDLRTGAERTLSEPSPDVHWSLPRWSPDGGLIAVVRWRPGGYRDVVVLDSAGRTVREVTADRAVDDAPAWSPDGRFLVFSSDRTGITNLYAWEVETGRLRQLTRVLSGAFEPDVSPDGRWIAFAWYTADGYRIARIPWNPADGRPAASPRPEAAATVAAPDPTAATDAPARPYRPWRSLRPTAWIPLADLVDADPDLGAGVGAALAGVDVIGRHAYGAYALFRPRGGRTDAEATYRYTGLGLPILDGSLSQEWTVAARRVRLQDGRELPGALLQRERRAGLGATWTRPRAFSFAWLSTAADVRDLDQALTDPGPAEQIGVRLRDFPLDVGLALAVGRSSVRGYDFSISAEDGWLASLSAEGRRYTRPFAGETETGQYLRLVGRTRAFRPVEAWGFARHALAVRAAAGADLGSRSPGFGVGGASGAASPLPSAFALPFGGGLLFPVRGYPEGSQRGDRAASATAEYRFPLALVERGMGTAPFFLDRLWGDVFVDAGGAWCDAACGRFIGAPERPRPLASVGAELGVDLDVGYHAGVALRGGLALPLRAAAPGEGRPAQLYLRFGRSF